MSDGAPPRARLRGREACEPRAVAIRVRAMADPPTHDADVVVVGAGLAGLTAARALTARGASVVVLEARDRVGGRMLNHDIGDGKVVEVGGQWIGPTQDRLAALAARARRRDVPDLRRGRERDRVRRPRCAATAARSRASTRSCCSTWSGPAPAQPARAQRPARRALGGAGRRALDGQTRRHLDAPQPRHEGRPDAARARHRGGLGGAAGGPVAAARALLHPLGRRPRAAVRHRGRRPAGPLRRRLAAGPDPDGGGARRERLVLGAPGAADRARRATG